MTKYCPNPDCDFRPVSDTQCPDDRCPLCMSVLRHAPAHVDGTMTLFNFASPSIKPAKAGHANPKHT